MEICIKIPSLPPSVNSMYVSGARRGMRFKSKEAVEWDNLVQSIVKPLTMFPCVKVHIELEFHGNWLTKDGKPKKKDSSNYIKAAEDSICKALGFDDCWNFVHTIRKVQSAKEMTLCKIAFLDEH